MMTINKYIRILFNCKVRITMMKHFTVLVLFYLLKSQAVLSETREPTFKYVTSYNKEGRFMTKDDIEKLSVNVLKPIIFIIGGLTNTDKKNDSWSTDLQDAYLEKLVHNVFIVDWCLPAPPESSSINKAHSAGLAVADFIATIFNKTEEDYLNIHLVGVSLGCEVAASAAERLRDLSGRKINRITGLDPAYYLINDKGEQRKLAAGNADFVDVVHTNLTDICEQIGHADFCVDDVGINKGPLDDSKPKSVALFATSVNSNDIRATKCDNIENFRSGACNNSERVTFGENIDISAQGKYYMKN
ncbi:lipase member H [Anoplophora glabripennis]|uniref:lipase member H n=1 Tax=Anoplophora glabripennis TaxID=217634 RepID=UPI0008750554|nr:lipase member H [Anoplophora glabripennis]